MALPLEASLLLRRRGFVAFGPHEIEQSIARRFEQQVDANHHRPAIVFGERVWTYDALDRAANRVAHALLAQCEQVPGPVVLVIEQGMELVAGIFGVLKAGKFYVPLETVHSTDYVTAVIGEVRPQAVLADAAGAPIASSAAPDVRLLRLHEILRGDGIGKRPDCAIDPSSPAYVYYTSGSTGPPKGVIDTHRNVLHNVMRYTNSLGLDRDDRLTLMQSPSFSGAVSSLFGALLNGATALPYDVLKLGTAGLGAWMVRERITAYHSVPALFRLAMMGAEAFPDLRIVRVEGDRMSRHDWMLFRERCGKRAQLVHGLGATECGLVRQFFIDPAMPVADGIVPIGYPVEDMEVRIVDSSGRGLPSGEVGDIVVRSRFLAKGYWRRPDLDQQAFKVDPDQPELRTYRTGDLGRMRSDGSLEHLGRSDARHKIRGQWIELADVEAALLGVPGIREAAARVVETPTGTDQLVAYLVSTGETVPTVSALRRHLSGRLAEVGVPSRFVWLEHLPLTRNAKVDRAALPAPKLVRPNLAAAFMAPRSSMEIAIAAEWAEVLGVDPVGVHDPFIDLGGDSLRLLQAQARLFDHLGVLIPPVALFEHQTVEALARYIEREHGVPSGPASVSVRSRRDPGQTRRRSPA